MLTENRADIWSRPGSSGPSRQEACANNSHHNSHFSGQPYVYCIEQGSLQLTGFQDYPDLEGDEARRGIWLVDVPLAAIHHLRHAINTGKAIPRETLERYEIPIVASALKLYLLELPGKIVKINPIYLRRDSNLKGNR